MFAYFWVFGPFARKVTCIVFRKVKTKIYLPESPFLKKSLAGAGGLVLMSVPAKYVLKLQKGNWITLL